MNGPNDKPERRYSEHPVVLKHTVDDMTLKGTRFYFYPVDEPPVIEVPEVDRLWYESTWNSRGWRVAS